MKWWIQFAVTINHTFNTFYISLINVKHVFEPENLNTFSTQEQININTH